MAATFDYKFNISGNFQEKIRQMGEAAEGFKQKAQSVAQSVQASFSKLQNLTKSYKDLADGIAQFSQAGISLDSQMHDLSAIGGVVGDDLKQIEEYARNAAKTFGGSASDAVTGYKLLLSQLSPELAKQPEALAKMGESIQITSKLMGGDGVAAAEVLTTAMNQYGVSLDDPMKASEEMARMMNVMAAAGQAGSAELPAIKVALEQSGMAAKAAGVSFEETNAAIQVLDKAGKKGAEGGVALRNVMSTLAKGRFLPKVTQEELRAANIDVNTLTDTSRSLHDRLEVLKPVMNDQALLTKLFGQANANAAMALIGGTDALSDFTDAVTGTNSAEAQAQTIMDSYAERQARINARIEEFKISVFQATGDLTLWMGSIGEMLVPLGQLMPVLQMGGKAIMNLGTAFKVVRGVAVMACRGISVAISSIPIIGWIALIIAGLIALGAYFWNTSAKFRATLKGTWAAIKDWVGNIKTLFLNVFGGIGKLLKGIFTLSWDDVKAGISQIGGAFSNSFKSSGNAYREAYNAEMAASKKDEKKAAPSSSSSNSSNSSNSIPTILDDNNPAPSSPLSNTGTNAATASGGSGGSKITHVTINLAKLVERFELHTTTLQQSSQQVREVITQTLLDALADTAVAID